MDPKKNDREIKSAKDDDHENLDKDSSLEHAHELSNDKDLLIKELFDDSSAVRISTDSEDALSEGRVIEMTSEEEFAMPDVKRVMEYDSDEDQDGSVLEDEHIDQNIPLPEIHRMEVRRVGVESDSVNDDSKNSVGFLYSFLDTVRFICLGLIIGMFLIIFVVQRNTVYGESMKPTLSHTDAVFVEMISIYTGNINRGDIVAIDAEGMASYLGSEKIIKRVIGLPGETVTIIDGDIYIDGVLLDESYLSEGLKTYVPIDGINNGYDNITLGDGEYYCLGDNRGASNDSRRLGPFSFDQIKSKVFVKVYPFDDMRFLTIHFYDKGVND